MTFLLQTTVNSFCMAFFFLWWFMSCFPWHTSHAMHVSSAGPRWGAVIGLEWFHTDIWAFLSLGFLTPSLSVFFGRKRAVLKRRGRSEGFSVYVCDEGQSHEKECVNYYSLNSRLNEERLTWWKPVNILRGRWRRAEEMKQNIQCDPYLWTQLWSCLCDYRESLVTLSGVVAFTAMTGENKHRAGVEAIAIFLNFTWTVIQRHFVPMSQSLAQDFLKKNKVEGSSRHFGIFTRFTKVKECNLWGGSYSRLGPCF